MSIECPVHVATAPPSYRVIGGQNWQIQYDNLGWELSDGCLES
jgi:hypothetical protein